VSPDCAAWPASARQEFYCHVLRVLILLVVSYVAALIVFVGPLVQSVHPWLLPPLLAVRIRRNIGANDREGLLNNH
jgi:hypothetical protein